MLQGHINLHMHWRAPLGWDVLRFSGAISKISLKRAKKNCITGNISHFISEYDSGFGCQTQKEIRLALSPLCSIHLPVFTEDRYRNPHQNLHKSICEYLNYL